jgi:putative thioredoxin
VKYKLIACSLLGVCGGIGLLSTACADEPAAHELKAVSASQFAQAVLAESQHRPVVVDFSADWCAACREMAPHLRAVARELTPGVAFVVVDADASPKLVQRYHVKALHTTLFFKEGVPQGRLVGSQSTHELRALCQSYLSPPE